jgi:1-pyrroline-5-carboxylate dehydrogenase
MTLPQFRNETFVDFTQPAVAAARDAALAKVRAELGREYPILIAGERLTTGEKLVSTNPSRPEEVIGIHQKATAEMARLAVETAHAAFPAWSRTPVERRVELALNVSRLIQERKLEFDAWLVLEAGKTWPETEPDSSEAIDFIEYYARQMLTLATPAPLVQMPGEKGRLAYLPLGVGVVIPPWNFPLAILAGMVMASLIAGNTVVLKPSSETPTIAAKFVELVLEAGFPPGVIALVPGAGSVIGDLLVEHPLTRFIAFTGSKDVGLRINELAAKPRPGQKWIKRVVAEMGGKDAIVVDSEADVDSAVDGVVAAAFGYQGQKCSACSRAIVDAAIYDEFLEKLVAKARTLTVGPADTPGVQLGPVISASAEKSILQYIDVGRQEGRIVLGGAKASDGGFYIEPTIIADVDGKARVFQEEIFGPVLAVAKARDFDHAMELANDSEYGLTGALYSRNRAKLDRAAADFFVGNLYLNRKCTGAMVGAHPFGGFNMSGTDSKAGGPDYLLQFLQAKSIAEKVS